MIFIYLRLPYRRQIGMTDGEILTLLEAAVKDAAADLGGKGRWMEERFILSFPENIGCALLRATEALRRIGEALRTIARRLHGYTLILEKSEGEIAEVAEALDRLWLDLPADGVWATDRAASFAARFVRSGNPKPPVRPVLGYSFHDPVVPAEWRPPEPDADAVDRVASELEGLKEGASPRRMLLVTGPGEAPKAVLDAALRKMAGTLPEPRRAGAGAVSSPLAPFLRLIPTRADDPSTPALAGRLVAAGLCRRRHSPALLEAYARYARSAFEAMAATAPEKSGWLVFEALDSFSSEALELLAEMLEGKNSGPSPFLPPIVATAGAAPRGFKQGFIRTVAVPPISPRAIAEAARLGALALGDTSLAPSLAATARAESSRLVLALRLAAHRSATPDNGFDDSPVDGSPVDGSVVDTERLVSMAVETLPEEFGGWLRAVSLAEDLLDDASFDAFMEKAGYCRGIRPLIAKSLAALGIVDVGERPRITRPELSEWMAATAGDHGAIDRAFASELKNLLAKRQILPSLALNRRLVEADPEERGRAAPFLDAVAADITGGPSLDRSEVLAPSPAFDTCISLFRSWTEDSGDAAAEAVAAFSVEASKEPAGGLGRAISTLARSIDDFSRGSLRVDASQIRSAIMRLHELGALRTEAKAHRLLGLSALSGGQIPEGYDYLVNAGEMAQAIPDELETFFASLAAAGASFTLGDIKRAGLRIEAAAEAARSAFRPDWSLGAEFAAARLDFELGRYGRAEETFDGIAEGAVAIGADAVAERATVWAGRSAAWSGMGNRARSRLAGRLEDAEACWFLAELTSWEGDWVEASRLADLSLDAMPRRLYRPVDALSWISGFDLLEGPCLGLWPSCSYLEDQATAFAAFVHSMAEGDPARIAQLATRSREGRIAAYHPQAHLYDWFAFIACETIEHPPVDPGTLISRAWKALQTRTLRMDEASLKNQFLEGNRWNREIVAAARSRRLI